MRARNPAWLLGSCAVARRRGRDSNPRYGCPHNGFRDRPIQPLSHPSERTDHGSNPRRTLRLHGRRHPRALRRSRGRLRRQRAAGPDRRHRLRAGQGVPRPRARRERVPARRQVRRRRLVRPARQARADRARAPGDARTSSRRGTASACSRSATSARRASRCPARRAPGLMADLDPVLRRQGPAADRARGDQGRQRPHDQLDDLPVPDAGVGGAGASPTWSEAERLARLERELLHVLRLDEADPIAAWRARADTLVGTAERLTERRFDALHYEGPGTDLTIGLLPSSGWHAARFHTVDGIEHMPNLPTEEVFTTPDPERTEGTVTSTKPLVLTDGTVVRDLVVRFEGGRVAELTRVRGRRDARDDQPHRRRRRAPRRGRARRPRGPDRQAGHDLLRHAARRERREPHRARPGLPVRARRRGPRALQRERDPHRLHDRLGRAAASPGSPRDGERVPVLVEGRWQHLKRLPFLPSRRGAGAAERARLEIV